MSRQKAGRPKLSKEAHDYYRALENWDNNFTEMSETVLQDMDQIHDCSIYINVGLIRQYDLPFSSAYPSTAGLIFFWSAIA